MMIEMWNERYSSEEYAYGTKPNDFLKYAIDAFHTKGKILMPAEGEGRNAVYAAKIGHDVFAFDISIEGRKKALKLAEKEGVSIHYEVGDFLNLGLIDEKFDVAALIYAHFPPPLLSKYYQKVGELVKPNGIIILEGFSKNHLKYQEKYPNVGGPKNEEFLFTTAFIREQFPTFEILQLEEVEVALNEGKYHIGKGSVIRFIGKKSA